MGAATTTVSIAAATILAILSSPNTCCRAFVVPDGRRSFPLYDGAKSDSKRREDLSCLPSWQQQQQRQRSFSTYLSKRRHSSQRTTKKKSNGFTTNTSSSLSMVSSTSAIAGAVSGGLIGGALHAIAGPDHLAALLPRCCGQRWYRAGRIGALWSMGHGISSTILGLLAFGLKNKISHDVRLLQGASSFMEVAIGASLILIGVLGIKEAREWDETATPQKSLSAAAADAGMKKNSQKRAVLFNGILHGFSWDGAPSLAPAVAVATLRGSITFLFAYAVGTMTAMALFTILMGEGTRRAGEVFRRPDLPQKLSFASSILAVGVGSIWCYLALR